MLYIGENQILTAILFFTITCIVLSSLGLIGLVSHSAAEKTKEIAVRKVFGADSGSIMISQNRNIFKMFLPGMAIGCALAWFIVKNWLENYAYRNEIELWIFILGPALILLLALLTVSFQTWKASRQAPAISLNYQ
jgi:putative ABC transport system permease protein